MARAVTERDLAAGHLRMRHDETELPSVGKTWTLTSIGSL
jgi:hypothetical protein